MIYFLLPLTGAIIGWITNVLAIRLLFRPQRAIRLWPLPITLQGLIPRRRAELADHVGEIVSQQLFSMEELTERLNILELQAEVASLVKDAVDCWCEQKMTMFPTSVRNYCSSMLRDWVAAEVAHQFPSIAQSLFAHMRQQVDVRAVVTEKINALSLDEVEGLVLRVARRELKQIEWLGALLGLLIGCLQALVILYNPL